MKFNLYIVFESFQKEVRKVCRSNKGFINILAVSDVKSKSKSIIIKDLNKLNEKVIFIYSKHK